jgi:hypothetical protein
MSIFLLEHAACTTPVIQCRLIRRNKSFRLSWKAGKGRVEINWRVLFRIPLGYSVFRLGFETAASRIKLMASPSLKSNNSTTLVTAPHYRVCASLVDGVLSRKLQQYNSKQITSNEASILGCSNHSNFCVNGFSLFMWQMIRGNAGSSSLQEAAS